MLDFFSKCHPGVSFLYFTMVLGLSMALRHPIAQGIAFTCALGYALWGGGKSVRSSLKFCLPLFLLTAISNPLFSSQGATVLFFLPGGSPVTLESTLYGLSSGAMLVTVFLWFSSFNRVITTDKLLCLFGKRVPALSLVLSMTLRLIPRFRVQLESVTEGLRSVGRDVSSGPLGQRLRIAGEILSTMVTWALENAIDTADSMKSRGYGLPGRTAYTVYTLTRQDKGFLLWLGSCGAALIAGSFAGIFSFDYFPRLSGLAQNPMTAGALGLYLLLCATPILWNLLEDRKWNAIPSKI